MAEAIKENTENVVRLNGVLDKTLQGAEKKKVRQCESAIDLAFKASSLRIVQEAASIIAHNNIDKNKEFIIGNINKLLAKANNNISQRNSHLNNLSIKIHIKLFSID